MYYLTSANEAFLIAFEFIKGDKPVFQHKKRLKGVKTRPLTKYFLLRLYYVEN